MPPSGFDIITPVLGVINRENPATILDVGICDGKWGILCREQLEMHNCRRYLRKDWKVQIHGIEIFEEYRTPLWDYAYDEVFVGDARTIVPTLGRYDLAILTEVIEHLEKRDGESLLETLMDRTNKGVIISFPDGRSPDALAHGEACGNQYEMHRSLWTKDDLWKWKCETISNSTFFLAHYAADDWQCLAREGNWEPRKAPGFRKGHGLVSYVPGSAFTVRSATGGVKLRLMAFPWGGMAQVSVNGHPVRRIDLYSKHGQMRDIWIPTSAQGGAIRIELLSVRNAESMGTEIWLDSIEEMQKEG